MVFFVQMIPLQRKTVLQTIEIHLLKQKSIPVYFREGFCCSCLRFVWPFHGIAVFSGFLKNYSLWQENRISVFGKFGT
jgi:hypothetical protein